MVPTWFPPSWEAVHLSSLHLPCDEPCWTGKARRRYACWQLQVVPTTCNWKQNLPRYFAILVSGILWDRSHGTHMYCIPAPGDSHGPPRVQIHPLGSWIFMSFKIPIFMAEIATIGGFDILWCFKPNWTFDPSPLFRNSARLLSEEIFGAGEASGDHLGSTRHMLPPVEPWMSTCLTLIHFGDIWFEIATIGIKQRQDTIGTYMACND